MNNNTGNPNSVGSNLVNAGGHSIPDLLHLAGRVIIGAIAIAYGTGFLVVFAFQHRFGIHEWGGDILRVKYIHAGLLYWLLPVSLGGPILAVLYKSRLLKLRKVS